MRVILLALLCFSAFQLKGQESTTHHKSIIPSDYTGKVFTDNDYTEIESLKSFNKITDTSFSSSSTFKEYGIKHLKKDSKHVILLLDRLEDKNGNKTGQNKILNSMEVNLEANEGFVIGYCGEDSNWDIDKIYAVSINLTKASKGKNFLSSITNIWKIEEENGFQIIKLTKDFNCLEDANYLIELAKL